MNPGTSAGTGGGRKALAAIVFTDVVGFAHHANTDEQLALACLQRDLDIMREVCARTRGAVLKTMGDGMLMRFPSANEAIECALEVQRVFHEQAKRLKPGEVLWHRIGVHLGDVVTTKDDVYGDGVNVAARLQAEAKPGSIFLSRTVYDVVKGKMKLPAVYVGPRHLKGIAEPIAVWEVPSLERQELAKKQDAMMAMSATSPPDTIGGFRGARQMAFVVVSILLLIGASWMLVVSARHAADEKLARPNHPIKSAVHKPDPTPDPPAGPTKTPDPNDPISDRALVKQLQDLLSHYDFAAMVAAVEASPYAKGEAGMKMTDRYNRLNSYMGWLNNELDTTDADHPITLTSDPGRDNAPATVYRVSSGSVVVKTSAATATLNVNQLTPAEIVAIGGVLEDFPGATEQISRSEVEADGKLLIAEPDLLNGH